MSLYIDNNIKFSHGLNAAIHNECNKVLNEIHKDADENPHYVVHNVRKALKKIRAGLRLFRYTDEKFYKKQNTFFRDEGRRISEVRDASSVIEALDKLITHYHEQLYNNTFNQFKHFLEKRKDGIANEVIHKKRVLDTIEDQLRTKCEAIESWGLEKANGFKGLAPGVKKVYKRGQKAFKETKGSATSPNLHEWRKRVKYLRYQLILLQRIWPPPLKAWQKELHKLSDYLGGDRDLYMLHNVVKNNAGAFKDTQSHQLLSTLIEGHRKQLQQEAILTGEKLYHLDKDTFVSLLAKAWEANDKGNQKNVAGAEAVNV